MQQDPLARLRANKCARQRLAKYVALKCFRNTFLEDLHAGKVPHSETGDYSDVRVVTPAGDIPWTSLSRLSDAEMKKLNIDAVNHLYDFITLMTKTEEFNGLIEDLFRHDHQPNWYNPPHHGTE